jgi:hypothetical protein
MAETEAPAVAAVLALVLPVALWVAMAALEVAAELAEAVAGLADSSAAVAVPTQAMAETEAPVVAEVARQPLPEPAELVPLFFTGRRDIK